MTENIKNDPQLVALMQVINEITNNNVPLKTERDFIGSDRITSKTIRHLQEHADNYLIDDGDLVHDLKSAIIELKYLQARINQLQELLAAQQTELARVERLYRAN